MTWSAIARKSPVQNPGDVVTLVSVRNNDTSVVVDREFRYDGTKASLEAAVRSAVTRIDAGTDAVTVVAPGTVLDLSEPAIPPPPTQAELDRRAYFAAKRKCQTLRELRALGRVEVTAQMVTDATTAWNALPFVAANEGL